MNPDALVLAVTVKVIFFPIIPLDNLFSYRLLLILAMLLPSLSVILSSEHPCICKNV